MKPPMLIAPKLSPSSWTGPSFRVADPIEFGQGQTYEGERVLALFVGEGRGEVCEVLPPKPG